MSLWDHLKKEGSLLGELSGVTSVVNAARDPLDWKKDLQAGLVLASYAAGGPMVRAGEATMGRALAARLVAAGTEHGGEPSLVRTAHAAWGTPRGGSILPKQIRNFVEDVKDVNRRDPGWRRDAFAGTLNGPHSMLRGNPHSIAGLLQKIVGGSKTRLTGEAEQKALRDAAQQGGSETRGSFFSPIPGLFRSAGKYEPMEARDGMRAAEKFSGKTRDLGQRRINLQEPYMPHRAAEQGRMTHPGADWSHFEAGYGPDSMRLEGLTSESATRGHSLVQDTAGPRYPHQIHDDASFLSGASDTPIRDMTPGEILRKQFPEVRRGPDLYTDNDSRAVLLQQLLKEMQYNNRGIRG